MYTHGHFAIMYNGNKLTVETVIFANSMQHSPWFEAISFFMFVFVVFILYELNIIILIIKIILFHRVVYNIRVRKTATEF